MLNSYLYTYNLNQCQAYSKLIYCMIYNIISYILFLINNYTNNTISSNIIYLF